ncbi:hypothetical protein GCM10007423_12090 [Dyadobacter endophyticus]|uniref:Uncharacterized protein n=1 Tax=Dyadobacter endophyticus TaxID=1749036 RepID=A0ABQ1YIR1_9BACT|nr:hypothetical protein [Dyadobacter endophyticus]GGH26812.1 hypothetical protein GCM10007423_12090 [Dyadobacter endophyticus]
MENQKQKGRPSKEKGTAKREHFSVWVSADQKRQINELIGKSGLSASQFFLTLALDIPFKRPKKRTLPKATAETIRTLEQLAGVLSVAVLKTKGYQMLSGQWEHSSQRVRLLADLITLWIFENFEIRCFQKSLSQICSSADELAVYLNHSMGERQSKLLMLERVKAIHRRASDLLRKYEAYYASPLEELVPIWKDQNPDPNSLHDQIEKALRMVHKRIEG